MSTITVGIIMNGVTGRMGKNQHLERSILEIIRQGGVSCGNDRIVPHPLLVGRNPDKLNALAEQTGIGRWTTDLDAALSDPEFSVYFDSQTTGMRVEAVGKAIRAGKHIYCEKPTALNSDDALALYRAARDAGIRHGVVQDKLWLPGIRKLWGLLKSGFFGDLVAVRGEFGYWVFDGETAPCQRPSWNYRKEDGGGIIGDMFPHWRYLLDNLFGGVEALTCTAAIHIPQRRDEQGRRYECTAEDAAYATFRLKGGLIAHFNSSWAVRVRRDDLFTLQIDGTRGSAVAGLRNCWIQPLAATPRPVWNPDLESPVDYSRDWIRLPDQQSFDNAFKAQWELFLRHLASDEPFPWDLLEGARGVQFAEAAEASWKSQSWVEVPDIAD